MFDSILATIRDALSEGLSDESITLFPIVSLNCVRVHVRSPSAVDIAYVQTMEELEKASLSSSVTVTADTVRSLILVEIKGKSSYRVSPKLTSYAEEIIENLDRKNNMDCLSAKERVREINKRATEWQKNPAVDPRLQNCKFIRMIPNLDKKSFLIAIVFHREFSSGKIRKSPRSQSMIRKKCGEYRCEGVEFPIRRATQVDAFELQNPGLSINVFGYEPCEDQGRLDSNFFPLRISGRRDAALDVDLLAIEKDGDYTYVLITKLALLLKKKKNHTKVYPCRYCLRKFFRYGLLEDHAKKCASMLPWKKNRVKKGKDNYADFTEWQPYGDGFIPASNWSGEAVEKLC